MRVPNRTRIWVGSRSHRFVPSGEIAEQSVLRFPPSFARSRCRGAAASVITPPAAAMAARMERALCTAALSLLWSFLVSLLLALALVLALVLVLLLVLLPSCS